jgi:hypothetical protein
LRRRGLLSFRCRVEIEVFFLTKLPCWLNISASCTFFGHDFMIDESERVFGYPSVGLAGRDK